MSAPVGSKASDFCELLEVLKAFDISDTFNVISVLLSIAPNLGSISLNCLPFVSFRLDLGLFFSTKITTNAIIEIMAITTHPFIKICAKLLIFESEKYKTN